MTAVWVRPSGAFGDTFAGTGAAMTEARAASGQAPRERIDWGTAYYGIPPTSLVLRTGDAFRELTAVAEEVRADVIVVGASTHAGHRLVGSLGVRLVRTGRCRSW